MSWLFWLMLAAVVAALAAVTGLTPAKTRPVARTQLMTVARVVLFLIGALLVYLAYRNDIGS